MTRCNRPNRAFGIGASMLIGAALFAASDALATPGIRNAFNARYPTSTLAARSLSATGSQCYLCHQPPDVALNGNCYKNALAARIAAGRTNAQAIDDVDGLDSDGDGVTNGAEITMVRTDLPGQVGYNPGLIGATGTDPCGATPNTAITNQRETPVTPCPPDVASLGGAPVPDGQLTVDDIVVFLASFFANNLSVADLAHLGGAAGADGQLSVDDVVFFLSRFFAGCP